MDQGERVYRQLYSRGGLSDQLSGSLPGLRGLGRLGTTAADQQTAANWLADPVMRERLSTLVMAHAPVVHFTDPDMPALSNPPPDDGSLAPVPSCDCMLDNIDVDPATRSQLATLCAQNPVAFGATLTQQGISLECQPPWYAQPKNLMIGGAVLAVGLVAWVALR